MHRRLAKLIKSVDMGGQVNVNLAVMKFYVSAFKVNSPSEILSQDTGILGRRVSLL